MRVLFHNWWSHSVMNYTKYYKLLNSRSISNAINFNSSFRLASKFISQRLLVKEYAAKLKEFLFFVYNGNVDTNIRF